MNHTRGFIFDAAKKHHGKNSFKSKSLTSFTKWLKMRFKEGRYPLVDQAEIATIAGETDLRLIHSSADLPRATWIGHATMLVQYRGINFLTDPHLTDHL
ncbi:MAG TPA: metallohydrolase, partial [Desulfobulbus sp.]|nr:metallohydrolase [Desulfobulbus sp.]